MRDDGHVVFEVVLVPIEDVPIVATALEGGAEYLVTDDSDLLDVKVLSVPGFAVLQVTAPGPFAKHVLGRISETSPQR